MNGRSLTVNEAKLVEAHSVVVDVLAEAGDDRVVDATAINCMTRLQELKVIL